MPQGARNKARPPPRSRAEKAIAKREKAPVAPEPVEPEAKPERLTKAQMEAEKYPGLDKHPALRRALVLHRALESGKNREEAERIANTKVGPRAPKVKSRMKKRGGTRPEPEMRQRIKEAPRKMK